MRLACLGLHIRSPACNREIVSCHCFLWGVSALGKKLSALASGLIKYTMKSRQALVLALQFIKLRLTDRLYGIEKLARNRGGYPTVEALKTVVETTMKQRLINRALTVYKVLLADLRSISNFERRKAPFMRRSFLAWRFIASRDYSPCRDHLDESSPETRLYEKATKNS